MGEFIPEDINDVNERVPPCTFDQYEVYAVDVALSTGDGKARVGDLRTTVFKRNIEQNYKLKMKSSRALLSEVDRKYPTLPFTLRCLKMNVQLKWELPNAPTIAYSFPIPPYMKPGAHVAHFKCTVLVMPSGTTRICGLDLPDYFTTDKLPHQDTKDILEEIQLEEERGPRKKQVKKRKRRRKLHKTY